MAVLLQAPYNQFLDDDGYPLTEGFVYTYAAGTDTPKATYTDYTGNIEAENPVELDAAGRADIWIEGNYKITVKNADGETVRTVDHIEAGDQGGDMTKAVYDPAGINQQLVGLTAVQTLTNKILTSPILTHATYSGGTTLLAPEVLTAGTNLTSAVAGSTEYDGKVRYFTPIGAQRGIVAAAQEYELDGTLNGANVNTAQNVLGVSMALTINTIYEFEGAYYLSKSAGSTTHTLSVGFGGTAGLNNMAYTVNYSTNNTSFATPASSTQLLVQTNVSTVVNSTNANTTQYHIIRVKGFISMSLGGLITPQYTLSAAPGGAYTTAIGSYFKIWPVGASGANVNVGAWS